MSLEGHPAWNELRQAVAELSTVSHANGIDYEPRGARDTSESIGGRRPPGSDREFPGDDYDAWLVSYQRRTTEYFAREADRVRSEEALVRLAALARETVESWRRAPLPVGGEPASMADPQWKRWVVESDWSVAQVVNRYGCSRQYVHRLRQGKDHVPVKR